MSTDKKTGKTDDARISVIDRRLKHPFGTPSRDIPLKGEKKGWVVRTFAADPEHPNRHYDAVHRLGWVPLTPADLVHSVDSMGFVVSASGHIVRGAKGEEMLMAMPQEDYDRVQKAKSDANLKSLKAGAVRGEVAQATAKAHGDQAGDQVFANFSQKEIVEPV